jgi:SanA protein
MSESKETTIDRPTKWLAVSSAVIPLLAMALIYWTVEGNQHGIFSKVDDVPAMPAAIVFGAGIDSTEMKDRVATAVALYKSGKVQKLLMTGDNGHINYNEPMAMKRVAIADGVPDQDIACDFAGFRTYDSLYRARDIFDVQNAVLVTQRYHLPRAIFLAEKLGLKVVGVDAGRHSYVRQSWYDLREIAAAEAAWLDVITARQPKYLGKKEPLFAAPAADTTAAPTADSTVATPIAPQSGAP